jgi:hypothetical protein
VSTEDQQTKSETDAEVRAAEIRAEVAATDERRAEEEVARQQEEIKKAQERAEKLAAEEREAEERAKRAMEDVEKARQRAGSRTERIRGMLPPVSGADAQSFAQRPEVQVGAAFAGAFIAAQVLKRIFD